MESPDATRTAPVTEVAHITEVALIVETTPIVKMTPITKMPATPVEDVRCIRICVALTITAIVLALAALAIFIMIVLPFVIMKWDQDDPRAVICLLSPILVAFTIAICFMCYLCQFEERDI